jgi:O-6-methylguanine DNA methyltransferase
VGTTLQDRHDHLADLADVAHAAPVLSARAAAWDVPVELWVGRPERLRLRRVRLDVPLPTSAGPTAGPMTPLWTATATGTDGRERLAAVAPDPGGIAEAWPGVPTIVDASDEGSALVELLDELRTQDDAPARGRRDEAGPRGRVSGSRSGRAPGRVGVLIAGTELQRRVLAALVLVPVGTTVTYAQLAVAAGAPRAVRAAARTMAVNRVPLVLPCHRVVPSSGGVGRYAWGTQAKATLLAIEAQGHGATRGGDARPGSDTGASA